MSVSKKQEVAAHLSDLIKTVKREQREAITSEAGESTPSTVGESQIGKPTEPSRAEPPIPNRLAASARPMRPRSEAPTPSSDDPVPFKKPVGKRSHPDYQLTGVYLRRSTALAVKRVLLSSDQDVSELIEELLTKWLRSQAA